MNDFLLQSGKLMIKRSDISIVDVDMDEVTATMAIHQLARFYAILWKKVIILLG